MLEMPFTNLSPPASQASKLLAQPCYRRDGKDVPAIEDWWSPLEKYGVGEQNVYEPGKNIDSYAKMAYEEVKEIGCGVTTCAKIGKVIVDCRYDM
ncbi:hypothetical protein Y032_0853g2695 [Ancylostoma ceylanicum]|nr:hypothetical protein Y032_0853g2695 [Ancylostoma ceylanicum]